MNEETLRAERDAALAVAADSARQCRMLRQAIQDYLASVPTWRTDDEADAARSRLAAMVERIALDEQTARSAE